MAIGKLNPKKCLVCDTIFTPKQLAQKYCTVECKGKWKYVSGKVTTRSQYTSISGNWHKYLQRLITLKPERKAAINADDLIEILERQNYRCALSGVELTCSLVEGVYVPTNVSIDRIEAGGPYIKDNIQLVCNVLNKFRSSTPLDQYIWWCKRVADHNGS